MSHLLFVDLNSFHAQRDPGPTQVAHCPFLRQEHQCSAKDQQVGIPVVKSLCSGVMCHDHSGDEICMHLKVSALKCFPTGLVSRAWPLGRDAELFG